MRRLAILLALLVVAGFALPTTRAASQQLGLASQQPGLKIVTSISPLADLIRNVGGDRVEVTSLVPPGGEPHDFDPTPADAAAVSRARVFFANGLGLETYLDNLVQSAGGADLEVVVLSAGLPTISSFGHDDDDGHDHEGDGNPHLWLDPQQAVRYVEVIRATLGRIDPAGAATYDANAAAYTAKLTQLDAAIEREVNTLPVERRVLVTVHDAYPYFAQRYGFTYLAVVSDNHEAAPSAQEYAQLVKTVKDNRVPVVFGEAGFSEQTIQQLAADTGAAFVGNLFTDTLSEEAPTNTYLGAMQYNADTIVNALR